MITKQLKTLSAALCLLTLNVVLQAQEPVRLHGQTMGTYFSIVVDGAKVNEEETRQLQLDVESVLADVNRQMSTWDEQSEISKFNKSDSTEWFAVSEAFAKVVTEAKQIYQQTDGAFDPTVAPLIDLWGFGKPAQSDWPDEAAIARTLETTGMIHIDVRPEPPAIRKSKVGVQLNLSAIAKGYGVDAVAELLNRKGYSSYVVDIGGENRTGIAKANGDAWKLGVESPLGGLYRILKVTEMSVATSGDYRNFFERDGVRYSHAIDPKTGYPVKNPPASVSVMHPSCMTADAWATAMMVLGAERGRQIADRQGLSVMFQEVANDQVVETSTGQFQRAEQAESPLNGTDTLSADTAASDAAETESMGKSGKASGESTDADMPWFPFVAAGIIFVVAITGMSIGTILQNKQLKGSCGGLASMPGSEGKSICELCTAPKDQCTNAELREKMQQAAAAKSDASDETA